MPNDYPPQQVSIKAAWGDAWVPVSYLYANALTSAASPTYSTAELTWKYGLGVQFEQAEFLTYTPQDIVGYFVRIEVVGIGTWFGYIAERFDEPEGDALDDDGTTRIDRGTESFVAYGLEYLLDRVPIRHSYIKASDGTDQLVKRAIAFNAGDGQGNQGRAVSGNASSTPGERATRVFAGNLTDGESAKWKAGWIIAYLLEYFGPQDESGNATVPFILDLTSQTDSINFDVPTFDPTNMTIKAVLDELISRRRGVGWKLEIDEQAALVKIVVFTFATSDVTMPSGLKLAANSNQRAVDFDFDLELFNPVIRQTHAEKFDQVVVRGARIGAVFSVSFQDGSLEGDWTSTQLSDFLTAASTADDYAGLSSEQKRSRNNDYRRQDGLQRVFSWFRIPADWDQRVGDGEGAGSEIPFPIFNDSDVAQASADGLWNPGLRIQPYLPLLTDTDYSGTAIDVGVESSAPDDSPSEFLRPFCLLRVAAGSTQKFMLSEHFGAADAGDAGRAQSWSCHFILRDDAPGFILEVVNGHQHYIGEGQFTALDDEEFTSTEYTDWRHMVATVYVLGDSHVEGVYPDDGSVSTTDVKKMLLIDVPDAHYDYVAPNTVVAIEDRGLVRSTSGGLVRNDRERLQDVARAAWEWYGSTRKTLELGRKGWQVLDTSDPPVRLDVGNLVTTIGSGATQQTLNTVVTRMRWDLLSNTVQLLTDHAEVDFANGDV